MFDKNNIVLILGAGASCDFGYPLGDELKIKVIQALSNSKFQSELKNAYQYRPDIDDLIKAFIEDLKITKASIDRFLAKSEKAYQKLGKVGIIKVIADCENDNRIFQNTNSWYKVLYNLMDGHSDLDKFEGNNLSILTFNYDRSLEHFFFSQLVDDHGNMHMDRIITNIKKIPIIHLHGRINMLPWEDNQVGYSYGRKGFVPDVFNIAEGMILPHNKNNENNVFDEAHQIIDKADIIYFLGFGYDEDNLKKLDINLISKKRVFSTSYKIPVAKQNMINDKFGKVIIQFSSNTVTVYDFLMNEFDPYRRGLLK